jgi:hypothetical protein
MLPRSHFSLRQMLGGAIVAWVSSSDVSAQVAIPALADAYVRAGSFSAQNFGAAHTLLAKKGVADDTTRRSYLKFDVSAVGDRDRVTLRLNGRLSSAASHNVVTTVYAVPDVTWDESSVTWNSRPNLGTVLGSVVVEGTAPQWVNVDLTKFVRAEKSAGRQVISVALRNVTHSSAISIFNSRESSQDAPALIIAPVLVNPHITVNPTSGTRPVFFNMSGTGFTPRGTADAFALSLNGSCIVCASGFRVATDGSFTDGFGFNPGSFSGTLDFFARDNATGRTSNHVTLTVK